MGWSYGEVNGRDVGYGVPAICDKPGCSQGIDRGLSHVCGEMHGGDYGCGLYFCDAHLSYRTPRGQDRSVQKCPRCYDYRPPYKPKPDVEEWIRFKLSDESWQQWRNANVSEVARMIDRLGTL